MLRQCSHNIAWMLCERRSPTLGTDIETMFTQCCLNVVWTLVPNVGHQLWDIIHTTLPECYVSIGPQRWEWCCHNIHTVLPECGLNIIPNVESNIATTFTQCCLNIVSMDQWWDNVGTNVVTTLPQCWGVSLVRTHWLPLSMTNVPTVCLQPTYRLLPVWLLLKEWNKIMHCTFLCHKSIYFEGRSSLSGFFVPVLNVTGRYTRLANTMSMTVPRKRTRLGRCAFSYRGPQLWSKLPAEARMLSKFPSFKKFISINISTLFENHPT